MCFFSIPDLCFINVKAVEWTFRFHKYGSAFCSCFKRSVFVVDMLVQKSFVLLNYSPQSWGDEELVEDHFWTIWDRPAGHRLLPNSKPLQVSSQCQLFLGVANSKDMNTPDDMFDIFDLIWYFKMKHEYTLIYPTSLPFLKPCQDLSMFLVWRGTFFFLVLILWTKPCTKDFPEFLAGASRLICSLIEMGIGHGDPTADLLGRNFREVSACMTSSFG